MSSTINTGEIYTIQGSTLQNLLNAVDRLKDVDGISVANLPSWMTNIQGRDWNYELNGNFPVTITEPTIISEGLGQAAWELPQITDPDWWAKDESPNRTYFFGDSNVLLNHLTNEFQCNRQLQYAHITTLNNNTNLNGMFQGCTSLRSIYINPREMANVTSVSNMFAGCNTLTDPPEVLSSGTNIILYSHLFAGCYGLITEYAMDKILRICINFAVPGSLTQIFGSMIEKNRLWLQYNVPNLSHYADFIQAGWTI